MLLLYINIYCNKYIIIYKFPINYEYGGLIIKNNTLLDKCSDKTKFWIFNVNQDYLNNVLSENKIAAVKKKSININKINFRDIILISSKFNNTYSIIGLTMVDRIYENDKKLFGYFESTKKINLKSIKYFKNPIIFNNIKDNVSIKYFTKKEIIEVSREDMAFILNCQKLIADKPLYLSDVTINYDSFLLNIIKTVYDLLNMNRKLKQMDIIEFIKIVDQTLKNFNVKIPISEIEKYYSMNVWKLNFRHVPSRDSDKNMLLYDSMGKSKNFGYIIFNHGEK